MKIYNPQTDRILNKDLVDALYSLRSRRNFNPEMYIEAKASLINAYMRQFGLKSCVVAVSGGIDSAVTLGLVSKASQQKNSPIKKVLAVLLPIFNEGATNQDVATRRGRETAQAFGISPIIIDLTETHNYLKRAIDSSTKISGQGWASGQLVSYLRTPALYYITSLLSQENFPAMLCGTTNRDEGSYLGYFGKASDGMVDVQIISDIHKSEVYKVGELLGVPKGVHEAVPTGDMFDGRTDEEVFGAPYDFVELYLLYLSIKDAQERKKILENFSRDAQKQFEILSARLEALHKYNQHKYLGKSPAVHLDIYESSIPGGWNNTPYKVLI